MASPTRTNLGAIHVSSRRRPSTSASPETSSKPRKLESPLGCDPGTAANQVKEIIKVAKVVHDWGESRELITQNRLGKYRFKLSKTDQVTREPAEYTAKQRDQMLAVLSPRLGTQCRPWALLMILGHDGVRASAALHLRWDEIDEMNGEVIWRAAYDKVGREWEAFRPACTGFSPCRQPRVRRRPEPV